MDADESAEQTRAVLQSTFKVRKAKVPGEVIER
jgi:hypothetical protein